MSGLRSTWHICRREWDTQIAILGKKNNSQLAVGISLACQQGGIPVAGQLCLPQERAQDTQRRKCGPRFLDGRATYGWQIRW